MKKVEKKINIITIGSCTTDDTIACQKIGMWFIKEGHIEIGNKILEGEYFNYNMGFCPERGDALDAIYEGCDINIVIALHLFGIDSQKTQYHTRECKIKPPGRISSSGKIIFEFEDDDKRKYYYNRNNHELLSLCMKYKIKLIACGDQPTIGIEKKIPIKDETYPPIFLYENNS